MAQVVVSLQTKGFRAQLAQLNKRVQQRVLLQSVTLGARFINKEAVKRAPRGLSQPGLASSDYVGQAKRNGDRAEVTFGFSAQHSQVMDQGFKVAIIKPIRAKRLFVPLSRRAVRQGPTTGAIRALAASKAAGPGSGSGGTKQASKAKAGGLVHGKDFLLLKEVKTPPLRKGASNKGPNRFMTRARNFVQKNKSLSLITVRLIDVAIAQSAKGGSAQ